jgi:hypothetical protein
LFYPRCCRRQWSISRRVIIPYRFDDEFLNNNQNLRDKVQGAVRTLKGSGVARLDVW